MEKNTEHRDSKEVDENIKDVEASLLSKSSNTQNSKKANKVKEEINQLLKDMPLTKDTTCGFWIFKGKFFQRFANQTSYVFLYGLVGCIFSMTYAYFNGTITTIEKRFKIPSQNTGIIAIGYNISQMIVSAMLSYYAGKGHRPRWIGFGILNMVCFCLLTALPHFLYGPGSDALILTSEFGAVANENATQEALEEERLKTLCRLKGAGAECEMGEGNFTPQVILFIAEIISGIAGALYYTLGVSYMDDNTEKDKTPALMSLSYFFHMLGPALGYALASLCLRSYISPNLTPVITNADPRWMGAWWSGWLILAAGLFISGLLFSMLPKQLPSMAARLAVEERSKDANAVDHEKDEDKPQASFRDMMLTFKRLITNKILMYNNISSVFYFFGYTPYWIFASKYIEIQFRQSASTSSMVNGPIALVFSAIGVLVSGIAISKYKPRARYLAAWNVIVGFLSVAGMISYAFIGCPGNEQSVIVNIADSSVNATPTCNSACKCDYVPYTPICGEDRMTYISPCHAGCKSVEMDTKGQKIFYDCACIPPSNFTINPKSVNDLSLSSSDTISDYSKSFLGGGHAKTGACPVDCFPQFVIFLAVMCFLKLIGASGRASNFLVTVRSVPPEDKTAAMGFGMMLMCLFTFTPAPIFFGWVLDHLCLVWGKTCTNKGNCWLYDPESLRYTLNLIAAVFVVVGTLFDCGVWYYVKDLKVFDDEEEKGAELKNMKENDESKE